jgi:hypothetical protein
VISPRRDTRALSPAGAEEQTARAISDFAQYVCLLSLQMGSVNNTKLDYNKRHHPIRFWGGFSAMSPQENALLG